MHECIAGVGEGVKAKNEKWLSARNARVRGKGRKGERAVFALRAAGGCEGWARDDEKQWT